MQEDAQSLGIALVGPQPVDAAPWGVALNTTAAANDVEVSLVALAVVDDVVRVSGLIRALHRPDARLADIPSLRLAAVDRPPLSLVAAHGLPHCRVIWMAWAYARPPAVLTEYEGRIEQVDLAYRAGGVVREAVPGPWLFTFRAPGRSAPVGVSDLGQPLRAG
jgi:hypothetical protein